MSYMGWCQVLYCMDSSSPRLSRLRQSFNLFLSWQWNKFQCLAQIRTRPSPSRSPYCSAAVSRVSSDTHCVPTGKHMTDQTASKASKPAKSSARPLKKLTRSQITEGLQQFPVEVLLSAGQNKKAQLTTKQRDFAHQLALGKTKAQAYRDSRTGTPAPSTIVCQPYKLAADARIQQEVEAYKLAIEAEKHRTPAQLKSLLVQQLVQHSLDGDFPPAQRVQCLKLLGSLFEVGAFVERKEVTTVNRSGDIRARIMDTLKDVTDITALDDGLSLLQEIGQYTQPQDKSVKGDTNTGQGVPDHGVSSSIDDVDVVLDHDVASTITASSSADPAGSPALDGQPADPTAGAPAHSAPSDGGSHTHSVPLTRSLEKSEVPPSLLG